MAKLVYPDFFNDVFGPIMQPGSSGGFAGTDRLARVSRFALDDELESVEILFNPSNKRLLSLGTWMEDRAYLGGILGFDTEDIRLFTSHEEMRKRGISYKFGELTKDNNYEDSTTFIFKGKSGKSACVVGNSVGGGMIEVYEINGYKVFWRGDTNVYFIYGDNTYRNIDTKSSFNKFNETFARNPVDITVVKNADGETGLWIESDTKLSKEEIYKFTANVFETIDDIEVRLFPCVLPIITTVDRKEQLFDNVTDWINIANKEKRSFVDIAIQYEKDFSGLSDEEIISNFERIADILYHQIHCLIERDYDVKEEPELPIYGKLWKRYIDDNKEISDSLSKKIITYALATNAKVPGTLIVPGPMGTGGGYLFSALWAVKEHRGYSKEKMIEGLIVAAAFGAIAYTRSNPSGERGCVGESGVCAAMAAAAVTQMAGGSPKMVENAASMALQASFGITCDAIPGGKEFPCITRTVRAAITAPLYADLALCGIDPLIPYHEVIDAMEEHYKNTPKNMLCGVGCALCKTNTAKDCMSFMKGDVMKDRMEYKNSL